MNRFNFLSHKLLSRKPEKNLFSIFLGVCFTSILFFGCSAEKAPPTQGQSLGSFSSNPPNPSPHPLPTATPSLNVLEKISIPVPGFADPVRVELDPRGNLWVRFLPTSGRATLLLEERVKFGDDPIPSDEGCKGMKGFATLYSDPTYPGVDQFFEHIRKEVRNVVSVNLIPFINENWLKSQTMQIHQKDPMFPVNQIEVSPDLKYSSKFVYRKKSGSLVGLVQHEEDLTQEILSWFGPSRNGYPDGIQTGLATASDLMCDLYQKKIEVDLILTGTINKTPFEVIQTIDSVQFPNENSK